VQTGSETRECKKKGRNTVEKVIKEGDSPVLNSFAVNLSGGNIKGDESDGKQSRDA